MLMKSPGTHSPNGNAFGYRSWTSNFHSAVGTRPSSSYGRSTFVSWPNPMARRSRWSGSRYTSSSVPFLPSGPTNGKKIRQYS